MKPCKDGKVRNKQTNRCKRIRLAKDCGKLKERNPATNRCRKKCEGLRNKQGRCLKTKRRRQSDHSKNVKQSLNLDASSYNSWDILEDDWSPRDDPFIRPYMYKGQKVYVDKTHGNRVFNKRGKDLGQNHFPGVNVSWEGPQGGDQNKRVDGMGIVAQKIKHIGNRTSIGESDLTNR